MWSRSRPSPRNSWRLNSPWAPFGDLDLIAFGPDPAARGPHGEEILLHGQLDEAGIHAGEVEMNRELVVPTVCVHRNLARPAFAEHRVGEPVELPERLGSNQHVRSFRSPSSS